LQGSAAIENQLQRMIQMLIQSLQNKRCIIHFARRSSEGESIP
jgi:hypothetical protein